MNRDNKELNKRFLLNTRPLLCLIIALVFLSVILLITMFLTARDVKKSSGRDRADISHEDGDKNNLGVLTYDVLIEALIKDISIDNKELKVIDINNGSEIVLNYTRGSSLTDKYGQEIHAARFKPGHMVIVGYIKDSLRLISMQVSDDAWEYSQVSNFSIDKDDMSMMIAKDKYSFSKHFLAMDEDELIELSDIAIQDVLMVRGIDHTIWSIAVTKGHGTVKLTDCEDFTGGSVTIGYETLQEIKEGLTITVREGEFNLTVENGKYSGTKNILVNRNMEGIVSLSDLGPEKEREGMITFEISPFGADLFIDNEIALYGEPIELPYGEHEVSVSLGGYTTYDGTIKLNSPGIKIKIDLPEAKSNKKVTVTEDKDETIIAEPESDYDYWEVDVDNASDINEDNIGENHVDDEVDYITDYENFIYIQNPMGASVYLNGDFLGVSPGSFRKIIGSHVLTFIKEGYETRSYTVGIDNDGLDKYLSFEDLAKEY